MSLKRGPFTHIRTVLTSRLRTAQALRRPGIVRGSIFSKIKNSDVEVQTSQILQEVLRSLGTYVPKKRTLYTHQNCPDKAAKNCPSPKEARSSSGINIHEREGPFTHIVSDHLCALALLEFPVMSTTWCNITGWTRGVSVTLTR